MYEFIKTATGWRIYWGPLPREEAQPLVSAPLVSEAAVPVILPLVQACEILSLTSRA
jgi:hypothetical protein